MPSFLSTARAEKSAIPGPAMNANAGGPSGTGVLCDISYESGAMRGRRCRSVVFSRPDKVLVRAA